MPRLVHLAPMSSRRGIERGGIRGVARHLGLERAVFAMPLVPDFAVTYQWLRELKRNHGERMIAVHFTVKSDESVLVGRYSGPHATVPLGEAIKRVLAAPAGAEIVVPRSIAKRDVLAFREMGQLVGWTEVPSGEARTDCVCPACLGSGTPDFHKRLRAAFDRLALEARKATTGEARRNALVRMDVTLERARGRISPKRILPFARAEDDEVRRIIAESLGYFRWADVEPTLTRLLDDPWPSVRCAAARSILFSGGLRRAWPLLEDRDALVRVALVEHLAFNTKADIAAPKLEALAAKGDRYVVRAIQRDLKRLLRDDDLDEVTRGRLEALAKL